MHARDDVSSTASCSGSSKGKEKKKRRRLLDCQCGSNLQTFFWVCSCPFFLPINSLVACDRGWSPHQVLAPNPAICGVYNLHPCTVIPPQNGAPSFPTVHLMRWGCFSSPTALPGSRPAVACEFLRDSGPWIRTTACNHSKLVR